MAISRDVLHRPPLAETLLPPVNLLGADDGRCVAAGGGKVHLVEAGRVQQRLGLADEGLESGVAVQSVHNQIKRQVCYSIMFIYWEKISSLRQNDCGSCLFAPKYKLKNFKFKLHAERV